MTRNNGLALASVVMAVSVFGEMTAAGELGRADNLTSWNMVGEAELASVRGGERIDIDIRFDDLNIDRSVNIGDDNVIVGPNNSGAVAVGPDAIAATGAHASFNTIDAKVALSNSIQRQSISGSSIMSGPGGGPALATGPITATFGGENLGVIIANMNTGIATQGAAVSISVISSQVASSP